MSSRLDIDYNMLSHLASRSESFTRGLSTCLLRDLCPHKIVLSATYESPPLQGPTRVGESILGERNQMGIGNSSLGRMHQTTYLLVHSKSLFPRYVAYFTVFAS